MNATQIQSTVFYLQMLDPAELIPLAIPEQGFELQPINPADPALNRAFYSRVGTAWNWVDRLGWSEGQWREYVARQALETWVLYHHGAQAGYFELERQSEGDVELVYFGLLPAFIGQGLGGPLLSCAIERAWALGARRVWVHTCSEDHPQALRNYQAKGFKLYREEKVWIPAPRNPGAEG